jgi:hypothetical protein
MSFEAEILIILGSVYLVSSFGHMPVPSPGPNVIKLFTAVIYEYS